MINVVYIFQFTVYTGIYLERVPVIGAVILSKLNGSMLFYICASFLLVGGIVQALFVQSLERKKS